MTWPVWIAIAVVGVLLIAAIVLLVGALLTLDWKRTHRAASDALPSLPAADAPSDGLVSIRVGRLRFRARVANLAGDGDGVILLHGFPQTSAAWEPLCAQLAARGYRVAAFDQRGYSPGARPRGVDNYTIDKLVGDVRDVADALGFDRFHLAGHDWGAAVGWGVVMTWPERVLSWTALSIAHSYAFAEAVKTDADQRRRSLYFLLFRRRWLPELVLGFGNRYLMRSIMYRWMPDEHAREYLRTFAEPGALTGALNWYRAMGRGGAPKPDPWIETPVLFIWGNRDPAAGRAAVDLQGPYLRGDYRFIELDAGHWLLERRADEVLPAIVEHIAAHTGGAAQRARA